MEIHKLTENLDEEISELSTCLIESVRDGASIGFLADIGIPDANTYWQSVNKNLGSHLHLWVLKHEAKIIGSIQLERNSKMNAQHRGEVQKLFVNPIFRGKGIATKLINTAESFAFDIGITTLILDTETGSNAERLYAKLNWVRVGTIPNYALSPFGEAKGTTYFYKEKL